MDEGGGSQGLWAKGGDLQVPSRKTNSLERSFQMKVPYKFPFSPTASFGRIIQNIKKSEKLKHLSRL